MKRATALTLALAAASALAACHANETPLGSGPDAGAELSCLPNLDGVIDADEVPVAVGVPVEYLVSTDRGVDLAGSVSGDGARVWDFSAEDVGDVVTAITARPAQGQWYADQFPDGEVALGSDSSGAIDAIYKRDDRGLWLLGLASVQPSPPAGTTLLVYDEPVAVLRFPLRPDDAWTSIGTISGGTLDGLPYVGTDTYDVRVDGSGQVHLPYVSFQQAHRVRTRVVVAPAVGGITTSSRQVSFLFECFGEVARATSRLNEADEDFTTAAELRRFAL